MVAMLKCLSDGQDEVPPKPTKAVHNIPYPIEKMIQLFGFLKVGAYVFTRGFPENAMKKQGLPSKEEKQIILLDEYDNKVITKNRKELKASFIETIHAVTS